MALEYVISKRPGYPGQWYHVKSKDGPRQKYFKTYEGMNRAYQTWMHAQIKRDTPHGHASPWAKKEKRTRK